MILEAALVRQARLMLAGVTPQKAKITNLEETNPLKKSMKVVFNPEKIKFSRDAQFDSTKTPDEETGERLSFTGGCGAKLDMNLFFDTTDTGDDVRDYTDFLIKLVVRKKKTSGMSQPPLCKFEWGEFTKTPFHSFKAFVVDLDIDYTWFLADGTPVRAEVHIVFKQADEVLGGTNPTSRSEARKIWVVTEGQSLAWIAYQEYGDCAAWRHIAKTNNMLNPTELRAGTVLKLTPLP